jgi:prepilin-type N-terminal cleavage/methylation domain-containing protein
MKGFTLIEILIALAIAATILAIIYGSYASSVAIMEDSRERVELYKEARLILRMISDEVRSVFVAPDNEKFKFEGEEAELHFSAASRGLPFDLKLSCIREVSYYLEPTPEGGNSLMRREQWPVDDDIRQGGDSRVLLDGLESLVFSYYSDEEERQEWGWEEEEERLPVAVGIVITFRDNADMKTSFSTLVNIPLALQHNEQ